jgi:RNA polymerase sigma factor (sigma-70 family)
MRVLPGAEWSNARLVEECLGGNQQAWHALLDRYKNLIYAIPLRYGASPQDAADIFQAVCIDLFNELPRLRDVNALQGWLIRVATHKCYHWKRQLANRGEDWSESALDRHASDEPMPGDMMASIERQQLVRDSLSDLPSRCRQLIELLFFEQPPLPYAEVAERLSLARGSIGFIRGRCLKRLKKILTGKGF